MFFFNCNSQEKKTDFEGKYHDQREFKHCVKSIQIWSFSGPHLDTFHTQREPCQAWMMELKAVPYFDKKLHHV